MFSISTLPPWLFLLIIGITGFFVILFIALKVTHKKIRIRHKKIKKTDLSAIVPDLIDEITSFPMTTNKCEKAVKEESLDFVKNNPEKYIEINMIEKSEVVDSFYLPVNTKDFEYGEKGFEHKFELKEDCLLLLPIKDNQIMLCAIFNYNETYPISFKQTNKGITANAFTILYNPKLYQPLLYSEDYKYNFWIVIMLIISTICYSIGLYFMFFHNGGIL
jgi:hypothetical protein